MGWVWRPHYWEELKQFLGLAGHMESFITKVESDSCTLGQGLDAYASLRGHMIEFGKDLPVTMQRKLEDIAAARDEMFFTGLFNCRL